MHETKQFTELDQVRVCYEQDRYQNFWLI